MLESKNISTETPLPDYVLELNEQQQAAVLYTGGPCLVIAGAGSGKTRVLTYKIAHLLALGFEPYRIMALTFTNKAAREMKERIAQVAGAKVASRLWMGTFHSIFLRLLRTNADRIGFRHDFSIYDASDSKALIKSIIKDLGLDEKQYKPAVVASAISKAKNDLVNAAMYVRDADYYLRDKALKRPMIGRIFELYTERLKIAQAMDFDDILYFMNVLLRDNPDILRHYSEFFRYILVDEYQDTNFAQHLIISQLSRESGNLCVVGDDAQSIYSFRGANISNILGLEKQYPGLKTFKLERNYRSTQNIVDAAGSLIAKNRNQIPKHIFSENSKGAPIRIVRTYSDLDESVVTATSISESKLSAHDSWDDYAILYRTNAQSRILEESLRKRAIPYRIYGGLSFYQRKEVKDAISYFRLALNPDDDEALRRIINYPSRGIGETTMKKLTAAAMQNGVSLWGVINSLEDSGVKVNKGTVTKLLNFATLIQKFIDDNEAEANAYELAQLIYNRTGMLASLMHDNTPESISRKENLLELLNGLSSFVESRLEAGEQQIGMADFISEVALATDQDKNEDTDEPKVTLMTVHASKGLEFKHIYIVGVEENLFPSALSVDSQSELEEERRLLYVAITRAKTDCTISFAGSRFRNGQTEISMPSRFLYDLDKKFLKLVGCNNLFSRKPTADPFDDLINSISSSRRPVFIDSEPERLRSNSRRRDSHLSSGNSLQIPDSVKNNVDPEKLVPGAVVIHNRYGRGTITERKEGDDLKIVVDFESVGKKTLFARIAVLTLED
ncbi:MAG: UvrD-helicase domain-containing protein [Prevotella sp.]|nr:UvrD-helicase domain-containing protein [Prevotella sp.]MCM1075356.1 UvrD-helicase domain-containing protein [Ruminococcus sp.]